MGMAVDEGGNEVAKTMMKDLLKTDAQKWKNRREIKNNGQAWNLNVRFGGNDGYIQLFFIHRTYNLYVQ